MNFLLKFQVMRRYRTQARFAVCCGRHPNWISQIIQGLRKPTEEEIKQICTKLQILDKRADYFPEGEAGGDIGDPMSDDEIRARICDMQSPSRRE